MGSSRTLDNIMLFDGCFDELQEDLYLPGQLPEPTSTSAGAPIYVDPAFMHGGRPAASASTPTMPTTTPPSPSPTPTAPTKQKKPSKKAAANAPAPAPAASAAAAQPPFGSFFGPEQAQQMYFQHVQHIQQQQQMFLQQQQQQKMAVASAAAASPQQALSSQAVKNQLKSKLKNQQAKQAQAQAQAQAQSMMMMQPAPYFMAPQQYLYPAAAPPSTQGVKEESHSGGSEDEDPEEQEDDEEDEEEEDDQEMEFGGGSFDPNESFVDEALAFDPPELGASKLEHLSPSYPISPPSTSSSSSPPPFGGTDSDSDSSSGGHTLAQSPFLAANSWQQPGPAGTLDPADETRSRPMSAMMETWPSKVAINRLPTMPPPPKNPKRSSHNAIERRYRDNINHKIIELRNAVPTNDHDEKLNKGRVLKKATDYIYYLCGYNNRLKEENTRLREILLGTGAAEVLNRYDQEVIARERAEMEQSERQEDAKGKKKKEPRQTKAKMADGVRVFVISAAFIGFFFSSPITMKSSSLGTFQSRVLESADPSSASSMDFFFQNGLEYVSWFALRFILLTLGLFSVLLGDPITSVDSDDFASSIEKLEQSQVSMSQGNAQLGRQLLAEALSYLGRPLPVSFSDQFFGFLWQLFRQISHFFLVGFWLDRLMAQRTCHTRNSYKQAAQLHFKLSQLDLSNYDSQTLDHLARLTNTLAAVNLMEAVEVDSAVLARVYASTALLLRLSLPRRLHFLSRYYLNLARKELQSTSTNDPALSSWLSSSAGYRFFMSNSWVPSMTDNSSVLPKSPLDPLQKFTRLFHENLLFTAFSSLSKESSSTSLRLFEEVTSSASLSRDTVSQWWAVMGQVFSLWKMGKAEEGNQRLLKNDSLFVPQTRLQLAANYAAFGQMLFRQQQVVPAMKAIDQVSALLESPKSNNPEFTVCGADDLALDPVIEALCAGMVLDIRLSAWQQLLQAPEEVKKQTLHSLTQISQRDLEVFKRASNNTAKLSNSAKLFMYKGTIRTLTGGSTPRTRSLFEKGCKIAHAEGSTFVEALILKAQAKFSLTGGEERKKLLKQALSKFQEVQALEEVSLTEALLF